MISIQLLMLRHKRSLRKSLRSRTLIQRGIYHSDPSNQTHELYVSDHGVVFRFCSFLCFLINSSNNCIFCTKDIMRFTWIPGFRNLRRESHEIFNLSHSSLEAWCSKLLDSQIKILFAYPETSKSHCFWNISSKSFESFAEYIMIIEY